MGFKIDIKGILQGVKNSIFVKEEVEKIAAERLSICRACPFNSENLKRGGKEIHRPDEHCTQCGCNLHLKTRSLISSCPLTPPKWDAVATEEENEKILDALEILKEDNGKEKK